MSHDYSALGISPGDYAKAQERVAAKMKAGTNPFSPTIAKVGLVVLPILLVALLVICWNGTIPVEAAEYVKLAVGIAGGCWGATLMGFAIKSIHSNKERIGETKFGKLVGRAVTGLKEKASYLQAKAVEKISDPIKNKLGPILGPHKKIITVATLAALFATSLILAGLALSGIGVPATSIASGVILGIAVIASVVAGRILGKKEDVAEDDEDSIPLPSDLISHRDAEELSISHPKIQELSSSDED